LAEQDDRKCHINGIAAESKNAARDEFVGMLVIDAHPKTLPKRNQASQQQHQPCQAKNGSSPGDHPGMEEFLCAYAGKF
jgi:hypothetical protein